MAAKFRKGIDLNGQRAVNAGDAASATDLTTLQQVSALVQGLSDLKDPVRGTTTGNLALTALVTGLVHDGVTYAAGDRILLKNQTAGAENGIYVIAASGSGTRSTDADDNAEVTRGFATTALEGTTKGTAVAQPNPITYVLTTNTTITLGTTPLSFAPIGAAGAAYLAGNGLLESPAGTFNVGAGVGLVVTADTVDIDVNVVARSFQADCAAATNPQSFTHGLGKRPVVDVINAAGVREYPDVTVTVTTITVDWGIAPTAAEYRVLAVG